jgi:molybdate transport system permease protein
MNQLWQPLGFSLLIAGTATLLVGIVGVTLAYLSTGHHFRGQSLLEALLTLPLVLPPTVVGYFLIILFGGHGIMQWIIPGFSIMFRPIGGVLAAAVVSLPLLYLPAKAAFNAVDPDLEATARLMGANAFQVFWHISLPLALPGIAAGLLLAFARGIGEFGATTMVMGSSEDRQTLPIFIFNQSTSGDLHQAAGAVWLLSVLSLVIILIYNRSPLSIRR